MTQHTPGPRREGGERMRTFYAVRVQVYVYEYDARGACTNEEVVKGTETKLYDRVTAEALYKRAVEATA